VPILVEQYIIRTLMIFCAIAAASDRDDVRDDARDAATALIRLYAAMIATGITSETRQAVREWCGRTSHLLDMCIAGVDVADHQLSTAQLAVLRLQVMVVDRHESASKVARPAPSREKVSIPKSGTKEPLHGNQKKILEFLRAHPDVRTRELIAHFSSSLSDRTIKRYLKELVALGILEREQHQGAVVYRVLAKLS